jgi:hypothetical protein
MFSACSVRLRLRCHEAKQNIANSFGTELFPLIVTPIGNLKARNTHCPHEGIA